jgi:hypothetical protein
MLHLPPLATVDAIDAPLPGHASKQLALAVKRHACPLLLQLLAAA